MVPRRRARGAAHPGLPAVERGGDGHPGQQARRRHRRPPVHVRQLGRALRGRAQPLLPREGRRAARRPHLLPGPRRARRLRPGLPRGPAERGRPRPLPHRDRPRRPELLPAPPADAGVLGVPDRLDGPRPDHGHLPRPLQPVPPQPPAGRHQRVPHLVLPGRRRVRRARDVRRAEPGQPGAARQPGLRRQLQPAAPRRPGARQRQDHPGAGGLLPGRGLERHQGDLGLPLGRAAAPGQGRRAAQQDEHHRRRRVPAVLGGVRGVHPRALLRAGPAAAQAGRGLVRRGPPLAAPRRPRLPQALRGLQVGHGQPRQRRTDRHPLQDDQGLDARPRGRGPQRHPPDQEAERPAAPCPARPPVPARRDPGRRARGRRAALLPPAGGLRRVPVHDGAPPRPGRPAPPPDHADPPRHRAARRHRRSRRCSAARAARPCRRRWRSPGWCGTWPGTRPSGSGWCPSSRTRPARSAWTPCSGRSRSTPPTARSTSRSTRELLLSYTESADGQILEEGITEAGAMSSFIAAGTSYASRGRADGALLHLLFDVRLPAGRRPHLAGGRRAGPAGSSSAPPPAGPRCSARACSTRTGTAWCWLRRCRRAGPTTRPSPTRWRRSSATAPSACTGSGPRTSSTT